MDQTMEAHCHLFSFSPCLQLSVVTSARDRKQNMAALHEHEQSCELLVFRCTSERKCSQYRKVKHVSCYVPNILLDVKSLINE